MKKTEQFIERVLGKSYDTLDMRARKVADHILERRQISRNTEQIYAAETTFGQRAADTIAAFGGSWTFICLFIGVMFGWVVLNSFVLFHYGASFDPYPYILLNLMLSMLAAIQAPIILMSQNRQAQKDRLAAEHDYEVNLKAELEIMLLHEKLDRLREQQWRELLDMQGEQIRLLSELLADRRDAKE